ncbi:hypothetical protein BGZ65_011897 [Modicella reniformis]|uniref:Uncharacterized protein n=1 Tax=Modicella reniformis TaxID=1440133 RepID=A0A9P6IKZ4_9FUNG|nr:hypothetical protein BGZ65_011897 [Modicella reniformis]
MSRTPKRSRSSASTFDDQDENDFTRLDTVQQSLEEEDEGKIPEIEKGSHKQKRRRVQHDSELETQPTLSGSAESTSSSNTGHHQPEQQQPFKHVRFNLELNQVYEIPSRRRRRPSRLLLQYAPSDATATSTSPSDDEPVSSPPEDTEDNEEREDEDAGDSEGPEKADEDWDPKLFPEWCNELSLPSSSASTSTVGAVLLAEDPVPTSAATSAAHGDQDNSGILSLDSENCKLLSRLVSVPGIEKSVHVPALQ